MKKLHLKRNATDRFALCGILPDHNFVLIDALPRQPRGVVCRNCISIATVARDDASTPVRVAQTISKQSEGLRVFYASRHPPYPPSETITPCSNCDSPDLVSVHLRSIDDELLECQSCQRLCRLKHGPDGTAKMVQV